MSAKISEELRNEQVIRSLYAFASYAAPVAGMHRIEGAFNESMRESRA